MKLEVPFFRQSLSKSCFPTSVKMVLKYYGEDIDEVHLFEKTKWGDVGTNDAKMFFELKKLGFEMISYWNGPLYSSEFTEEMNQEYKRDYDKAKRNGFQHRKDASIDLIKNYLDEKIPVLAEVKASILYDKVTEVGHTIVIIGYDREGFIYNDPYSENGKGNQMLYKEFKKAWDSLGSYGRSMSIITAGFLPTQE